MGVALVFVTRPVGNAGEHVAGQSVGRSVRWEGSAPHQSGVEEDCLVQEKGNWLSIPGGVQEY